MADYASLKMSRGVLPLALSKTWANTATSRANAGLTFQFFPLYSAMPKRAKKPDASYEAFRAEWERQRKAQDRGGSEWLTDKPKLPVVPLAFMQMLQRLAYLTQDDKFIELRSALMRSDLIDIAAGAWSLSGTKIMRLLPELIEEAIAAGTPERQAIAEAVAVFELYPDAASFDAAWKRLRTAVA